MGFGRMAERVGVIASHDALCPGWKPTSEAAMGRPLTTADVGCRVAQLGGQLSGGEIARPTVAARPNAVIAASDPLNLPQLRLRRYPQ
jgi:hypothetical protein